VRRLHKPGNETGSNASSAAGSKKAKTLYIVEVCLYAEEAWKSASAEKRATTKKLQGAKAPKVPKVPKAKASAAASGSRTLAATSADADAFSSVAAAIAMEKEVEARCIADLRRESRESLAETPRKPEGGKKRAREAGHTKPEGGKTRGGGGQKDTVKSKHGRRLLWTLHFSAGKLQWFYYNVKTKITSWRAPDAPEGWVKKKGSGTHRPYVGLKLYYLHLTTKEASYEVPEYID
jgi:hypothetical protein